MESRTRGARYGLFLGWLFLTGLGCATAAPASGALPPLDASARVAVASLLDDWHGAAADADEKRYFAHLADDAVFLGTDATERWGKDAFLTYAHPHFAKGKAWRFRAARRDILLDESRRIGWFDEDLVTEKLGPARGSGVVRWQGDRYVIVQYNLAATIPNDRFDVARQAIDTAVVLTAEAEGVGGLDWISGAWVRVGSDSQVEEHWTSPDRGALLGVARRLEGSSMTFFEYLRIERRGDSVVYVASPRGGPTTDFLLDGRVDATVQRVSFVAPTHDYPKRITYWREGPDLLTRIEGDAGQPVIEERMRPAAVPRR